MCAIVALLCMNVLCKNCAKTLALYFFSFKYKVCLRYLFESFCMIASFKKTFSI